MKNFNLITAVVFSFSNITLAQTTSKLTNPFESYISSLPSHFETVLASSAGVLSKSELKTDSEKIIFAASKGVIGKIFADYPVYKNLRQPLQLIVIKTTGRLPLEEESKKYAIIEERNFKSAKEYLNSAKGERQVASIKIPYFVYSDGSQSLIHSLSKENIAKILDKALADQEKADSNFIGSFFIRKETPIQEFTSNSPFPKKERIITVNSNAPANFFSDQK